MSTIPPLPPGFTLDSEQQQAAIPPLPPGFTLDAPQAASSEGVPEFIKDIGREIYNAGASGLDAINRNLNPFNAERQAATLKESQGSPFDLKPRLESIAGVGRGLMGVPEYGLAGPTGAGRAVIGHGLEATGEFTYEEGKAAADKALMAARPTGKFSTVTTPASTVTTPTGTNVAVPAAKSVEFTPPSAPGPTPKTLELKAAGSQGYQKAEAIGVEFKRGTVNNITQKVATDLAQEFNPTLAPKTFGTLAEFDKIPQGPTVTIADLRTMQRQIGTAARSIDPTERAAAMAARDSLNGIFEKLTPNQLAKGTTADLANALQEIRTANANYSKYHAAKLFEKKMYDADLNTGTANSGMNAENALRQQVKTILKNEKLRRNYTPKQIRMMEQFAKGMESSNVIRGIGNILSGGGGMGAFNTGAVGAYALGPAGAAIPLAGMGAKAFGNMRAWEKAAEIGRSIRAGSPLAKSVPPVQFPPSPLLSPMLPYSLQQSLPLLLGMKPVYADDE
jgi:hypothetical protein